MVEATAALAPLHADLHHLSHAYARAQAALLWEQEQERERLLAELGPLAEVAGVQLPGWRHPAASRAQLPSRRHPQAAASLLAEATCVRPMRGQSTSQPLQPSAAWDACLPAPPGTAGGAHIRLAWGAPSWLPPTLGSYGPADSAVMDSATSGAAPASGASTAAAAAAAAVVVAPEPAGVAQARRSARGCGSAAAEEVVPAPERRWGEKYSELVLEQLREEHPARYRRIMANRQVWLEGVGWGAHKTPWCLAGLAGCMAGFGGLCKASQERDTGGEEGLPLPARAPPAAGARCRLHHTPPPNWPALALP